MINIQFYEGAPGKTTGAFFSQAIAADLAAGKTVLYIDAVDGWDKNRLEADPDRLFLVRLNGIPLIRTIIDGMAQQVKSFTVYIDHWEHLQAY